MNRIAALALALSLAACGGNTAVTADGGAGDACATYAAAAPAVTAVTVRLVNQTGKPLYLGQTQPGCGDGVSFTVKDGAGTVLHHALAICEPTCANMLQRSCACAADCAMPTVTLVADAGAASLVWKGSIYTATKMPAACYADGQCAASECLVEGAPPAGPLTFGASAYTTASGCQQSDSCTCTPDASGTCQVEGASTVTGTKLDATATWKGEASVDLVFH